MEPLGERPVWSMSGSDKLHTLDHLDAELARLDTYRLHVIAGLDDDGYAAEIGAHDTAQLLEYRYRLDRTRARRDLRLAKALTKYPAVAAALPDTKPPTEPTDSPGSTHGAENTDSDETTNGADNAAPADEPAPPEIQLHPAQAEAIVAALDTIPTTVAPDNVAVAEHQLIGLARHLSPAELRKAGTHIRDLLDTDGPEPEEHKAYTRETLTLITADRGVKFRGYLANENAELLRTLIHTGARPHKTLHGDPDPRPREKRQADALTTALTLAATTLDTTHPTPRRATPTGTGPTGPSAADVAASATTPPDTTATNPPTTSTLATGTSGTSSSGTTAPATTAPGTTAPGTTASGASARGTSASRTNAPGTSAPGASTRGTSASRTNAPGTSASGASAPGTNAPGTSASGASAPGTNAPGTSASRTSAPGTRAPGTATTASDTGREATTDPNTSPTGTATANETAGRVPGFGAKANITVTIDLNDLKAATADAIGDTVYGNGLSAATIRRLACDANIIPLVLGTNSEPLDVGRSERLVTRAQRRALNTRDKGCVICGAPPINCDAHHLISWIDGGKTNITNLVLLCRRHHIDLHAGHWTITITGGQVHVDRPTWATPPRPQPPPAPPQSPTTGPGSSGQPRTPSQPDPANRPGQPSTASPPHPINPPNQPHAPSPPNPADPPSQPRAPSSRTGPLRSTPNTDTRRRSDAPAPTRASTTAAPTPDPATKFAAAPDQADAATPRAVDATASRQAGLAVPRDADSVASRETDANVPCKPAAISHGLGSLARRSAIGRELLERLASAAGADAGDADAITASSLREAACLAIWGEPATDPDDRRTTSNIATSDGDRPFDPWAEPTPASVHDAESRAPRATSQTDADAIVRIG